jgi:oxidase EvaA
MNLQVQHIRKEADRLSHSLESILHFAGDSTSMDFYISSLTDYNPFNTTEDIVARLQMLNEQEHFHVEQIPLTEMEQWYFDEATGDIRHVSGKFFSIRGLKVQTNIGPVKEWTQPVIYQPEIGVLGLITKKINGILYFLMQIKTEPGNLNNFQLSPTVQATRSNYTRVHGGKSTLYLDYFLTNDTSHILVDQLQSEQGARFYRKRNRNIIIRVPNDQDIELLPNFKWLTLGQIKQLARLDNLVNMDARSVISTISYDAEVKKNADPIREEDIYDCLVSSSLVTKPIHPFSVKLVVSSHGNTRPLQTIDELLINISQHKFDCILETQLIPLNEVQQWHRTEMEICHNRSRFFSVMGIRVTAESREIPSWDQPIVRQISPGIVGFVAHDVEGVVHFLVQLKMESGNMDLLELAPTVQCITDSYKASTYPPFVSEIIEPNQGEILFDTMQSEEGGRFYHEENRNIMVYYGDQSCFPQLPRYLYMTMHQLKLFTKFNNFLNVEARSLLAIL